MSDLDIDGHRIGVLFPAEDIAARVNAIAREIAARQPENLVVVPILKGSFVFAADLIRAMHHAGLSPEVDFMILSSYKKSTKSSGQVTVLRDIETDVRGRDVLLIDDILESGRTLAFAKDLLSARGARTTGIAPWGSMPILLVSPVRIYSWWAMEWTLPIPSGNCRLLASSKNNQLSCQTAAFKTLAKPTQSAVGATAIAAARSTRLKA